MQMNMGLADRIIRVTMAVIIMVLYFTNVIPNNFVFVLVMVIGVLGITSLLNFCPLYSLIGIHRKETSENLNDPFHDN